MDAAVGLTFRDPQWLWGLLAVPLVALFFVARERMRRDQSRTFISERIRGVSNGLRRIRPGLLTAALALALLALAGPQYGFRQEEIPVTGFSRVFVLDVSQSMSAADVGGSRLQAAKALIGGLLDDAPERVGLILFEGEPMTLSPLTADAAGVATLLESVTVAETAEAGSDIGEALLEALEVAREASPDPSDIVIVSDGEHQGADPAGAIERAEESGVAVHTIMIGSRNGATIPSENGVLASEDGKTVITRASDEVLAPLAAATGGEFLDNPFVGPAVAQRLASEESGRRTGTVVVTIPFERFQIPLAASLLLLFAAGIVNRGAE